MFNDFKYDDTKGRIPFLVGFFLISIFFFLLVFSSSLLIAGFSIQRWYFPVSILAAIVCNYFIAFKLLKESRAFLFYHPVIYGLLIVVTSIIVSSFIYDTSWDGQRYHQESVYQLKEGWNPCYTVLPPAFEGSDQWLWVNYYPKAIEISQAGVYSFTNKIETGKSTNLILAAAAFFLLISLLLRLNLFSRKKNIFYAALFVLNPVTISQALTYYIDGQQASLIVCLLVTFAFLLFRFSTIVLALLCAILTIFINVKFTSPVFAVVLVGGLLGGLLWKRAYAIFKRIFIATLITGILSAIIIGYNPYIINLKSGHNLFYPVKGENKIEIMGNNLPITFRGKGRMEKFFLSFFSRTQNDGSWVGAKEPPKLKIPFSVRRSEIAPAKAEDTRLAGFGPFFSGIMIVTIISLLVLGIYSVQKEEYRNIVSYTGYSTLILFISVFIVPEAWWARFVPQLWLIPIMILFFTDILRIRRFAIIKNTALFFILLNIGISLLSIPGRLARSVQVETQLAQFRAVNHPIKVQWNNSGSMRIRLTENRILFSEAEINKDKRRTIQWSDSFFEEPEGFPLPTQQSVVLKLLHRFKSFLKR